MVDAIGPGQESTYVGGLRRFQIEIVGDGQVVVNDEPCTTAKGICTLDVPPGTVIILKGDFGFQSESGGQVQEGRCTWARDCRVTVGLDQTVIRDVDVDGSDSAELDGRPFGLLPGQPGIIVDDFQSQTSRVPELRSQGGQLSN